MKGEVTMKVKEVMTRGVEVVHSHAGLPEAAALMRRLDVGSLPVVKDGRLTGILTDRDIAVRAVADNLDMSTTLVDDVMSKQVHSVKEEDDLDSAARLMADRQIRRVPVLGKNGQLSGILSMADLAVRSREPIAAQRALEGVSQPARPRR
jgi:CBS domain-containing protein